MRYVWIWKSGSVEKLKYVSACIYKGSAKIPTPSHVFRKWVEIMKNDEIHIQWVWKGNLLVENFWSQEGEIENFQWEGKSCGTSF